MVIVPNLMLHHKGSIVQLIKCCTHVYWLCSQQTCTVQCTILLCAQSSQHAETGVKYMAQQADEYKTLDQVQLLLAMHTTMRHYHAQYICHVGTAGYAAVQLQPVFSLWLRLLQKLHNCAMCVHVYR